MVVRQAHCVARLPPEVEDVFERFRTCELSTLAGNETPITWPKLPFWRSGERAVSNQPKGDG
jgi:hypothetical protein